jgi:divalent metal cation (Fe/Co/Zn/Cd) transporter
MLKIREMKPHSLAEAGQMAAVRRVQLVTVLWMVAEVLVSALIAMRAHSIAMLAFGGDSAIELLSALVVILRFSGSLLTEQRAARITALLLFALAAFIVCASVLSLLKVWATPEPTYFGIVFLLATATVMPVLARRKRQLSEQTGSSALAADAAQSSICAWLAWIALAGLALNAGFRLSWADPLAALGITPIVLKEGRDAWQEKACHCC